MKLQIFVKSLTTDEKANLLYLLSKEVNPKTAEVVVTLTDVLNAKELFGNRTINILLGSQEYLPLNLVHLHPNLFMKLRNAGKVSAKEFEKGIQKLIA